MTKVFIPFRFHGMGDPRRAANLDVVQAWWYGHGFEPVIISDGGLGDEPFNKHRAYNLVVDTNPGIEVFIFAEPDTLVHPDQIRKAVRYAERTKGLVIPFTEYRYLSDKVTGLIRDTYYDMGTADLAEWWALPASHFNSIFDMRADEVRENTVGAVRVVSRATLVKAGGFTEASDYDHAIEKAFACVTNKTRYVYGPAIHLFDNDEDAVPQDRDLLVFTAVERAIQRGDKAALRRLMLHRSPATAGRSA